MQDPGSWHQDHTEPWNCEMGGALLGAPLAAGCKELDAPSWALKQTEGK